MRHSNIEHVFITGKTTTAARLLRPGYALLLSLLIAFAILVLGFDPEQARATRHIPLELTGTQAMTGLELPGEPLKALMPAWFPPLMKPWKP